MPLLRSLGVVLLLNLLSKPLWVLAEQAVQNALGHATMGLFAALLALAYTLRPISDAGLNQSLTKRLAAAPARYPRLVGSVLALRLGLAVGYLALLVGVGAALGYRGTALYYLLVLGGLHVALGLLEAWRAVFQGMQHFRLDGLAGIWDKTLLVVVVVGLLVTGTLTLERFVWANFWTMAAGVVVFGAVVVVKYGRLRWQLNRRRALALLRQSAPLAAVIVLFSLHERLNLLLLERLAAPEEAGYYYAAFRWVGTLQMYLWTVLPIFYARFAKHHRAPVPEQQAQFTGGLLVVWLPMAIVCGFLFFQGERLLFMFEQSNPQELSTMATALKVLALMLFVNAGFNVYSTYLTATGRERFVNRLLVVATVVSTLLNLYVLPRYGAVGAAWVLTGSFAFISGGYAWAFHRRTELRIPVRAIALSALAMAVFAGVYVGLLQLSLPWWLPAPLATVPYAVAGWRLGLMRQVRALR